MITSLTAYLSRVPIDSICTNFFLYLGQFPRAHTGDMGAHSFELHEENIGLT